MSFGRYEVLSGEVRRRRWPRALKEEIVLESLAAGATVTQVARRRGIDRSLIYRWRRELKVSVGGTRDRFVPVELAGASSVASCPAARDEPLCADDDRHHGGDGSGQAGRMEIALDGGRRITVFADVDGAALSRVLGVLAER